VRALAALALLALFAGSPVRAAAQAEDSFELKKVERLRLDDIEAGREGERVVELYLRALTRYGEPVEQLHAPHLAIRDANEAINPKDVELVTLAKSGRGVTCVIAIDVSRTMQGEPFERARAAALELVGLLEPQDRVAIVAISDEARVVSQFSASQAAAKLGLEQLSVDSEALQTLLYDGVYKAVELLHQPSLPRRSFAIVFSDGKDGGSQRSLDQVIEFAKGDEHRPPALVFTIGYARFGGEGLASLDRLAKETNADFLQATSTIHFSSFFAEIWKQMKGSYVVRYPGDLDGELHNVEVSIDNQTARRAARYPKFAWRPSPKLIVVGGVVLVAGIALLFMLRGRSAGKLVFHTGPLAGRSVPLRRGVTRIGAIPENNDVVLQSGTVSRYHAAIHCRGGRVEIEDLNSTNGTFVNGTPVRASPLRSGDKVRIADVDLVYER